MMIFVDLVGVTNSRERDEVTSLWYYLLRGNHIETQVYPVSETRAIIMVNKGSHVFEVKRFLLTQKNCHSVTIDGKLFLSDKSKTEL